MRQANTPDGSDQYALALHGLSLPGRAAVAEAVAPAAARTRQPANSDAVSALQKPSLAVAETAG